MSSSCHCSKDYYCDNCLYDISYEIEKTNEMSPYCALCLYQPKRFNNNLCENCNDIVLYPYCKKCNSLRYIDDYNNLQLCKSCYNNKTCKKCENCNKKRNWRYDRNSDNLCSECNMNYNCKNCIICKKERNILMANNYEKMCSDCYQNYLNVYNKLINK